MLALGSHIRGDIQIEVGMAEEGPTSSAKRLGDQHAGINYQPH